MDNHDDFLVVRYLFDKRPDGRYVPRVEVQRPGQAKVIMVTDPEGRTYRNLNRDLEMDFWLLTQWRTKHASRSSVVITP